MKNNIVLLLFIFVVSACSSDSAKQEATTEESTPAEAVLKLAEFESFKSSIAYPDATITDYTYEKGKFSFNIPEGDYELGVQTSDAKSKMCANSSKGQHIHLIMNDAPYAAKYTADFDYDLPDGEQYLLAFLSRSYHESIKTDKAHVAEKIVVKAGSIESKEAIMEPMLFYSRPKGTYVGKADTKRIMLDFYLVNATLGKDQMVKVEVNNEEAVYINKWEPHYLDGLPMGENTVKLTLVDADGNKVDTPLNPVSRTFTLKEDQTENLGK